MVPLFVVPPQPRLQRHQHQLRLERHGLPWFYFIPSPDKVVEERREQYIREAKRLWGECPGHSISNQ